MKSFFSPISFSSVGEPNSQSQQTFLKVSLPGADRSQWMHDPCGCGGLVHDGTGAHGGCDHVAYGGPQTWPGDLDPAVRTSSSGPGCCWLA